MKIFYFFLFLSHISICYAQQDFLCRGKISDAITKSPLKEVMVYKIYRGDTIKTQSNANGIFQISLNTDSRLFFKMKGYGWKFVEIANKDMLQIYLNPSEKGTKFDFLGHDSVPNNDETDLFLNGQLVPKEEWDDAMGVLKGDTNLFKDIVLISSKMNKDGKNKVYVETY